ncbi:hypothetical protein E1281_35470 [Actinomadura sp. KC345]|uniref:hypothetical protein n=1 Tax=Actinomadura sp. KC345 TaxID=2530371 RepID=UPI001053AFCE|nr:hypothetical protein [Actinomadura sp. KC345]TDC43127.1 hypothetical protein E1281_35470 [Actinomadura sp. KC345]
MLTEVERVYRHGGAGPAMATFGAALGMRGGEDGAAGAPEDPELLAMFARFERNTDFFVGYEVPSFGRSLHDLDALRASSARITLAAGEESAGEPPNQAAHVLAGHLGTKAETYPGDHGGFGTEAEAFAQDGRDVLGVLTGAPGHAPRESGTRPHADPIAWLCEFAPL